jgi:hypothetical protein
MRQDGFDEVDILSERTTVRFSDPERFIPLAVINSAATATVCAELDVPDRLVLLACALRLCLWSESTAVPAS